MLRRSLGATAVALLAIAAASAAQNAAPAIVATPAPIGRVSLRLTGVPGSRVTVFDGAPAGQAPLATVVLAADGSASLPRVAAWACAPTTRTFAATFSPPGAAAQTATTTIQTPSCAHRLSVRLRPSRPRAGRPTAIQVGDRWHLGGLQARVCSAEPGGSGRRCTALALAPGQIRAAVQVRPRRAGRHPVGVAFAGRTIHRVLVVRPPSARLRVLATGDSMIQIIDGDLRQTLGERGPITVRSDAHISTGISKPFMLDWVAHARSSARAVRPDVTVMFLGANDGFPMRTPRGAQAQCCGRAWVREYGRRARKMMRFYARNGAGTVYWLLLPAPRGANFAKVFTPVNRALRRAARAFPGVVHLIDLPHVFTPGGRFRQTMIWHGRRVSVRQPDGVHLSIGGASIATQLIVRRMRRDGLIGRR